MSTTNPVSTGTSGSAAQSLTVPPNMQISETGFLRLITTQLQAQNPLQPTNPTQFLSQIEGMSEVSSMQSMQSSLQASQVLSGTSLLGKSVLAPGSTATLTAGGSVAGAVTAPQGATNLLVSVQDAAGTTIKAFQVSPQASGLTNFTWDGTTSAGTPAPAGRYTINVTAAVNGTSLPVSPLVQSTVSSVTIDPTTQSLNLDTENGAVPLSSVAGIL